MPKSVLEAIQEGYWDYEPEKVGPERYDSTTALPGSPEKLTILAERLRHGEPLWHPSDRRSYDDSSQD